MAASTTITGNQTYKGTKGELGDIFDEIDLIRVPREYFSIGIAEVIEQFQDLMNIRRSQRLENIELVLQKPVLLNYNFDFDVDNLFFAPGNLILSNNITEAAIREFDFSDITGSSYQEDQIDMLLVQDASAMADAARGQSSHSRETATGIVQLQRAALKRAETSIKGISINWLRSVTRKILIQIRTYMSQQEYERLIGQPDAGLFRLSIKEISQMLDIMPVSTSLDQIREQEQQSYIQAMQTLIQMPEANRPEFIKMYIELFHPNKNPDKFIIPVQPEQPSLPSSSQGQQPGNGPAPPNSPKVQTQGAPTISPDDLIRLAGQGRLGGQQGRT